VLLRSGLRILGIALGMLLLYAVVPVPGTSGTAALLGMAIGLVLFVVLVGWQLRTIVGAEHPVLRAVEVVVFALPMLVVIFAFTLRPLTQRPRRPAE
jgi:voltage-gated potassium channel